MGDTTNKPQCITLETAQEDGPRTMLREQHREFRGPRHEGSLGGIVTTRSLPEPAHIRDVIGPDPALWLANVTGLPYAYVSTKLAEARANLEGRVA